jgi:hypothetical protein
LTLNTVGQGHAIASPDRENGNGYLFGTWIHLTAIPDSGWTFSSWTGDIPNTHQDYWIIIIRDLTITANFKPLNSINYTIRATAGAGGSISPSGK